MLINCQFKSERYGPIFCSGNITANIPLNPAVENEVLITLIYKGIYKYGTSNQIIGKIYGIRDDIIDIRGVFNSGVFVCEIDTSTFTGKYNLDMPIDFGVICPSENSSCIIL